MVTLSGRLFQMTCLHLRSTYQVDRHPSDDNNSTAVNQNRSQLTCTTRTIKQTNYLNLIIHIPYSDPEAKTTKLSTVLTFLPKCLLRGLMSVDMTKLAAYMTRGRIATDWPPSSRSSCKYRGNMDWLMLATSLVPMYTTATYNIMVNSNMATFNSNVQLYRV